LPEEVVSEGRFATGSAAGGRDVEKLQANVVRCGEGGGEGVKYDCYIKQSLCTAHDMSSNCFVKCKASETHGL